MERIEFDASCDQLWLVGDLVNRGPDSSGVLRRAIQLGDAVTAVLGNHDLHLLAAAAGVNRVDAGDTFHDVLDSEDGAELIDWLRRRPLLQHDPTKRRVLVHAGLPPHWDVATAKKHAREVEAILCGDDWRELFAYMYGDEPRRWSEDLSADARHRYTINALTRMRFLDADGALEFSNAGSPDADPRPTSTPWFQFPNRQNTDTRIIFGHWAALGYYQQNNVVGLDTGCIWGGCLSAVPLEPPGDVVSVSCAR